MLSPKTCVGYMCRISCNIVSHIDIKEFFSGLRDVSGASPGGKRSCQGFVMKTNMLDAVEETLQKHVLSVTCETFL